MKLSSKVSDRDFEEVQAPSRIQAILMSPGPITFIVPDTSLQEMSLALRISHDLHLYHRLDSEVILESSASLMLGTDTFPSANIVFIGHPSSTFVRTILNKNETSFRIKESLLALHGHMLQDSGIGNDTIEILMFNHLSTMPFQLLFFSILTPNLARGTGPSCYLFSPTVTMVLKELEDCFLSELA